MVQTFDLCSSGAVPRKRRISRIPAGLCAIAFVTVWTGFLFAAPASRAPIAAFTFSPSAPLTGDIVSFDGSSSICSNAKNCSYRWTDDADGSLLGAGFKISSTFPIAGTKNVRLTVTDSQLRTSSVVHSVIVSTNAAAPVPAFTYSPSSPIIGSPVSFDGSSSTCLSLPCSYRWTDDADASQLATGMTMSFTFQGTGTKYVRVNAVTRYFGVYVLHSKELIFYQSCQSLQLFRVQIELDFLCHNLAGHDQTSAVVELDIQVYRR